MAILATASCCYCHGNAASPALALWRPVFDPGGSSLPFTTLCTQKTMTAGLVPAAFPANNTFHSTLSMDDLQTSGDISIEHCTPCCFCMLRALYLISTYTGPT
ncbi:hypothetical protein GOP47_0013193 [Adiantum capillus-veneris]|uniref:Uncharacterized protein n=1 Tax=Adiantum capillus-veneris TaxID=13818 RepID=A0A9D4ZEB0_ADICA|nr:hypothetical protein GOP47_0013193 [Adiantum capillus-veneris]